MKHICEICGYTTNRISNFKDHQNRKKPCKKKERVNEDEIKSNITQNGYNRPILNNHENENNEDIDKNMLLFSGCRHFWGYIFSTTL